GGRANKINAGRASLRNVGGGLVSQQGPATSGEGWGWRGPGGVENPRLSLEVLRRRFGRPDRHEHDEHDDADQRHQDQITDGSAAHRDLPKLNARSIDDPADPVKLPLRLKNEVVPLPLLIADPVNWPLSSTVAPTSFQANCQKEIGSIMRKQSKVPQESARAVNPARASRCAPLSRLLLQGFDRASSMQ